MDFFFLYAFPAVLLLLIGVILFFSASSTIKKRTEMQTWPKAQAVIDSSAIEERKVRTRRNGRTYIRTYLMPLIRYTYRVLGDPYQSQEFSNWSGGSFPNFKQEELERMIENYPPGKTVTVTYNPDKPAEAYLVANTSLKGSTTKRLISLILMATALVWVTVGAISNLKPASTKTTALVETSILPITGEKARSAADLFSASRGLVCTDADFGGIKLVYINHHCQAEDPDTLDYIEVLTRKEEHGQADMASVVHKFEVSEDATNWFVDAAALAFEGDTLGAAQDWIRSTLPTLKSKGDSSEVEFQGALMRFDVLGKVIRLNIGRMQ